MPLSHILKFSNKNMYALKIHLEYIKFILYKLSSAQSILSSTKQLLLENMHHLHKMKIASK